MPRTSSLPHLRAYLSGIDAKTRQRGDTYARQGRVHGLKLGEDGTTISANVHGTHIYNTSLIFQEDHWWSQCDCPVGADCKHAVALAMCILRDDFFDERPPLRTLRAQVAKRPAPSRVFPGGFPSHLLPWEKKRAQALEQAYADYLDGNLHLNTLTLESIFGTWPGGEVFPLAYDIFPEQRLAPEPFWHFLLAFAKDRGVGRIPDFGPLNDLTATLPLIQAKRNQSQVSLWRKLFQEMKAPKEDAPTESIRLRLRIIPEDGRVLPEIFHPKKGAYTELKESRLGQILNGQKIHLPLRPVDALILRFLDVQFRHTPFSSTQKNLNPDQAAILAHILRAPVDAEPAVVTHDGQPLLLRTDPLRWHWMETENNPETPIPSRHHLTLARADGSPLLGPVLLVPSPLPLCIWKNEIHPAPAALPLLNPITLPLVIPEEALLSDEGIEALLHKGCGLPPALAPQIRALRPALRVELRLAPRHGQEWLHLAFKAQSENDSTASFVWNRQRGWTTGQKPSPNQSHTRDVLDLRLLHEGLKWLDSWEDWVSNSTQEWKRPVGRNFAETFTLWAERRPDHVILHADAELASLLQPTDSGTWKVTLKPSGQDWFDLSVQLTLNDTTLTAEETQALLDAQGGLVRLAGKGWRRLAVDADPSALAHVLETGIDPTHATGSTQRLHALQVAASPLLHAAPPDLARRILERAAELEKAPPPPLPSTIRATLRPYQTEGFHFLARMSRAHLGGVLADDMGLGKTIQALSWLAWLRETEGCKRPSLVVCPKSVMDVWMAEAARFYPSLPLVRGNLPGKISHPTPLVVLNYAQLRNYQESLQDQHWQAVLLDEGQSIKNPDSQSAKAACALQAEHRLVLSGTPIENRLLDLWSLLQFAMPGVLGNRAGFSRHYNEKRNPQARSLLARRVRPFLLRRTKDQVARDLPARIEEDILCELDGPQLDLYNAHLKDARRILLDLKTTRDLDKARFNILTSLLRLRQACCHPSLLVKGKKNAAPSAKLEALLDLLDPLFQEGHKVLIFSQFVEMLGLLRTPISQAGWPIYYLDGSTENRQDIVRGFQSHEGAAAFLISLKAGGAGLNLTAASYVVLFDPWWNPAVEAQAIDRTHRIGQEKTVIAYRLLAKNTIEEKIRQLQKAKARLFQDVLGEENFAKVLTLDDFRFLLEDDPVT
jgi:superfamily II DNA or RNA helicase